MEDVQGRRGSSAAPGCYQHPGVAGRAGRKNWEERLEGRGGKAGRKGWKPTRAWASLLSL